MLLGLKKRLNNTDLSENERRIITKQIEIIQKNMQLE